jgi:hypothetical protein
VTEDPYIHRTAEEAASRDHEKSLAVSNDPSNYKDQYKIQTISHPELEQFEAWYKSGKKVWPKEIQLTPTVLKYWYVSDGSFNNNGSRFYVSLHCSNERKNKQKVEGYFTDVGLRPSRWWENKVEETHQAELIFNKEESKEFFDYIGNPLPGFEYKWP